MLHLHSRVQRQPSSMDTTVSVDGQCSLIVQAVRDGDIAGAEELYRAFGWLRTTIAKRIGAQDAEDLYHDVIVAVVKAIRKGGIRDAERLPAYVKGVVRHLLSARLRRVIEFPSVPLPSWHPALTVRSTQREEMIKREYRDVARSVLDALKDRDREVLMRFYIDEQDPGVICADLGLTENQFRLIKSRAKERLTERVRRAVGQTSDAARTKPRRSA